MAALVVCVCSRFQFLGIPPKGEPLSTARTSMTTLQKFPISRDPPEGGTGIGLDLYDKPAAKFPISRDPPEGGTSDNARIRQRREGCFQFLGIPPKGEL